ARRGDRAATGAGPPALTGTAADRPAARLATMVITGGSRLRGMWQSEVRVDLDAIRENVARLKSGTSAELMAVVKADGYGHGMVPAARAALDAGADWLGVCTLDEALLLRQEGVTAPVLAWLLDPGLPLHDGVAVGVDLGC